MRRAAACASSIRPTPTSRRKTIFSDPDGCIYDMNVSYDARTLFFSYRRKGEQYWHIWRIHTDGTGLGQLTDGPFYDISPCLLPDGEIVFVSTRRFGHTSASPVRPRTCTAWPPTAVDIRCVSMNTLSDFSPQMLPDGRVLFTRWEYIDRDLTYRQSLWTQDPEGTVYQLYFGNTIRDVGSFLQARPLPGSTDRVVATFAPHHGFPHGAIGLIDRRSGAEGPKGQGYMYVTQEFPTIGDGRHEWAYRDPFPLSESSFLCSYGGGQCAGIGSTCWTSTTGSGLVYEDPDQGCYFPHPAAADARAADHRVAPRGGGPRDDQRASESWPAASLRRLPKTPWARSCWPTSTAAWNRRSHAAGSSTCGSWSRSARARTWCRGPTTSRR